MTRRAACSCGQLSAICDGEPARVALCHCLACKQRTGSAFGLMARFAREHVAIAGRSTVFVRVGDSGDPIDFHFCPLCGTTVYWELKHLPEFIAIAVGAFREPEFPAPQVSAYEVFAHPWAIPRDLEIEHRD